MLKQPKEVEDFLYLQIATRIENLIENDVYRIGDRLPSVRMLSSEQGISLSTAFQSYYHLENKGLIESRPKSGYFVKFSQRRFLPQPQRSKPTPVAKEVSMGEMIANIYQNSMLPNMIRFSMGSPNISLLPEAKLNKALVQAMRSTEGSGLDYENLQGNKLLRNQIAKRTIDWGGSINPEEIVITNGCMEALVLALKAITKPGDTVAVESPTYFGAFQAIENMGLKVLELCTCPEDGIDLDKLEPAIEKFNIKACLIINFNNPIGSSMPDENKKRLVEILAKYEIPLIEDDIYGDLYYDEVRPRTCKSYDKNGLVLLCSSFSKTLAPGYRIGWVMPGIFKEKLLSLKHMNSYSTATITQVTLAHFLDCGRYDLHLKKLRSTLHCHVLKYTQAICNYFPPETKVTRPRGGFVLWLELPEMIDTFQLFNKAIEHNVSFMPGKMFSAQNRYNNCMRISCGNPLDEKHERGLELLGKLVKECLHAH